MPETNQTTAAILDIVCNVRSEKDQSPGNGVNLFYTADINLVVDI